MKKTEIYVPAYEPDLSVWVSCDPSRKDVAGYTGITYLHPTAAYIALPGAKGMNSAVLAHEAVHAATHLIGLSKLRPPLKIAWPAALAPTKADAREETLAWLVEQIVAGTLRAHAAWQKGGGV